MLDDGFDSLSKRDLAPELDRAFSSQAFNITIINEGLLSPPRNPTKFDLYMVDIFQQSFMILIFFQVFSCFLRSPFFKGWAGDLFRGAVFSALLLVGLRLGIRIEMLVLDMFIATMGDTCIQFYYSRDSRWNQWSKIFATTVLLPVVGWVVQLYALDTVGDNLTRTFALCALCLWLFVAAVWTYTVETAQNMVVWIHGLTDRAFVLEGHPELGGF